MFQALFTLNEDSATYGKLAHFSIMFWVYKWKENIIAKFEKLS